MTTFEKILIPLIEDNIKKIDLTSAAGFIDSYTADPDKGYCDDSVFLVYDDTVRNDFVADRARRLAVSFNVKRTYVKYVNGKPLFIYELWCKPELKKMFTGIVNLNGVQKMKIVSFWGSYDDVVEKVLMNNVLTINPSHNVPNEDSNGTYLNELTTGIMITKKAVTQ